MTHDQIDCLIQFYVMSGWKRPLVSFKICCGARLIGFRCCFRHVWWCLGYCTNTQCLQFLRLTQKRNPVKRFALQVVYDNLIVCNLFPLCFDFCSLCLQFCCIFSTHFFHPRRFGIKKGKHCSMFSKTVHLIFHMHVLILAISCDTSLHLLIWIQCMNR